ncbi:MAG: hypothetical protein ABIO57_01435 [Candidatus Paceibacterota bacterium]
MVREKVDSVIRANIKRFARSFADNEKQKLIIRALDFTNEACSDRQGNITKAALLNSVLATTDFLIDSGITDPFIITASLLSGAVNGAPEGILKNIPDEMRSDDVIDDAYLVVRHVFGDDILSKVRPAMVPQWSSICDTAETDLPFKGVLLKNPESGIVKLAYFYTTVSRLKSIADPGDRKAAAMELLPALQVFIECVVDLSVQIKQTAQKDIMQTFYSIRAFAIA